MKPVCVPCQRFFRPTHNGVSWIEGMPIAPDAKPGTEEPDNWKPYKLWVGDEWTCRGCGAVIIVGVPLWPRTVHHEPGFEDEVTRSGARLQINDC